MARLARAWPHRPLATRGTRIAVATRGSGTSGTTDTTSHAITLPTGVVVGELLVVVFSVDGNPTCSTTSTGWIKVGQASDGTNAVTGAVFYKLATGSDALTVTTSAAEQSTHVSYRVVGGGTLVSASATGSSTNSDPPSATDTVTDLHLWIATRSGDSTAQATVAPSGYTNLATQTAGGTGGASTATAHRFAPASASENPATFTSTTEQWVSWTLGFLPARAYPSVRELTDDFTTQDTTKWSGWGANVAVVSGVAQITTTNSYNNLQSVATYDARNAITSVELPQAPNLGNGTTSAFLQLNNPITTQRVRMGEEGGTLQAAYDPGTGSWTTLASTTFNSTAHKIWRIREAGAQIYFETSSNGAAWSVLAGPVATPVNLSAVQVVLISGYYGTEPTPGSAQFDNFNGTYADPPPDPRVFYVSNSGSDSNDGLSTGAPFLTLGKVNTISMYPGDQVLLKRGGTWAENLTISGSGTVSQPITISTYDVGAAPIIDGSGSSGTAGSRKPVEVYGSFITLDGLEARGSQLDDFLLNGPDCIIQNCTARWGVRGIHQGNLGSRAQILNNTIVDVNVMVIGGGPDDDYGAMGVLLEGDGGVVTGNTMTNCWAVSPDYTLDGSAVDVYNGTNAIIAYNVATECNTFFEAGGTSAHDILVHHNVSACSLTPATGAVVHGTGTFGPVLGVELHHNTLVVTGTTNSYGVWASAGAGIDLQNNIIVAPNAVAAVSIGSAITEAGNVFQGTFSITGQSIDASSTTADPNFFAPYGDLRIPTGSPAVDRGADLGYTADILGTPPSGTVLDSGAYEAITPPGLTSPIQQVVSAALIRAHNW